MCAMKPTTGGSVPPHPLFFLPPNTHLSLVHSLKQVPRGLTGSLESVYFITCYHGCLYPVLLFHHKLKANFAHSSRRREAVSSETQACFHVLDTAAVNKHVLIYSSFPIRIYLYICSLQSLIGIRVHGFSYTPE